MKAKSFRISKPKFLLIKSIPAMDIADRNGKDSQLKHWFNRAIEKSAKMFRQYCIKNVDEIHPSDRSLYDIKTGHLSERDM